MPSALISFLGTSPYKKCRYSLENEPGPVVTFVQEDFAERFCQDWTEQDEIRIFTTSQAERKNWEELAQKLDRLNLRAAVRQISIPVGNSEKEIWEIFNIVFESIRENETILFDITHSFRSIPMLFMALAGYAGVMKNAGLSGIYYGAFEVLGSPRDIEEKIPDPGDRVAPIFDLTPFAGLLDWSRATQSFLNHGVADDFLGLITEKTGAALRRSSGKDRFARKMNFFARDMETINKDMFYNRGCRIIDHDYDQTLGNIENVKKDPFFIPPFGPLVEKIEDKIRPFKKYSVYNGFRAVEWDLAHGMIQQAMTMLWETIMTWILEKQGLDWRVLENRDAASSAVQFIAQKRKPDSKKEKPLLIDLVERLKSNDRVLRIAGEVQRLRILRNDLNHGGFRDDDGFRFQKPDAIKNDFEQIFRNIKDHLD